MNHRCRHCEKELHATASAYEVPPVQIPRPHTTPVTPPRNSECPFPATLFWIDVYSLHPRRLVQPDTVVASFRLPNGTIIPPERSA